MNVLEITIRPKFGEGCRLADTWPVVAVHRQSGSPAARSDGTLSLNLLELREQTSPLSYGAVLGRALFQTQTLDRLNRSLGLGQGSLRLLLNVEDAELRALHWERLCAPIKSADRWEPLALDQSVLFSFYLPSPIDRRFPVISFRDLRALVVVANPPPENKYSLARFDAEDTVHSIRQALGEIPSEILADVKGADGPPTLDELATRLTGRDYTLLHVVAHGTSRASDGEPALYLLDADGRVEPVSATRLLDRLTHLEGADGLPRLAYLSACETASQENGSTVAIGGLAQRLVQELGMPAVVAMTEPVSIQTAEMLASRFYRHLRSHGEADRALAQARAGLAERADVAVPTLYSRLGGRSLFSDTLDCPLTPQEIDLGLTRLEEQVPVRAPVLAATVAELSAMLRQSSGADQGALKEVDALCSQVIERSFCALAQAQDPLPRYDARCPFQGLSAFDADSRAFFFGREEQTKRMADRLAKHPFLAVLGPSGSGKSSLVLAGLVPALQDAEPGLPVAYLKPGSDPVAQLERALLEVGDRTAVVLVDQFEELFTHNAGEEEQQAFIDRLLSLPHEQPVVLTMRADFWGDCAPYERLAQAMQAHQEVVDRIEGDRLRQVIEDQADAVGLRFEAGLSYSILDDVRDEPGAMPLLQHVLRQLWERRHGPWLKAQEYQEIGGAQQAIAKTADDVYAELGRAGNRDRVRDIMVRLVRLDDDVQDEDWRDTRRRASLMELTPAGEDATRTRMLVEHLADDRIVTTRDNTVTRQTEVEVAHEALIRYWPTLRAWLREDRAILRLREGVRRAAREWDENEQKRDYLYHRGERLESVESQLVGSRYRLNELEQSYLDASLGARVEGILGRLREAIQEYSLTRSHLDELAREGCHAPIWRLEEPGDADVANRCSRTPLDRIASLLGADDVAPSELSLEERTSFGPVARSAVGYREAVTRQTAALALAASQPDAPGQLAGTVDRIERALAASRTAKPRWWRRAELRGAMSDAYDEMDRLNGSLALWQRLAIWLWRVQRRILHDRRRFVGLTVGTALGAGLGLGLLRTIVAALAPSLQSSVFFSLFLFQGAILGAALCAGLLLAEHVRLRPATQASPATAGRKAEQRPDAGSRVLAIVLGGVVFGTAHVVLALMNGANLAQSPLAAPMGYLAGLGLSSVLYDRVRPDRRWRPASGLLRLAAAAAVFALVQWIFIAVPGKGTGLAIALSSGFYRGAFQGTVSNWGQQLPAHWFDILALVDAALVGSVLTAGCAAGLATAKRWLVENTDVEQKQLV